MMTVVRLLQSKLKGITEKMAIRWCKNTARLRCLLIQMAGIAVKNKLTKEQFDATCAVHPTMSEELVTMRNPMRTA